MSNEIPYKYYDNKLGVKISFLISDSKKANVNSLCLVKYSALYQRMARKSSSERQLKKACLNNESLILFSSLKKEWREKITLTFGNPPEKVKESFFAKHYFADRKAYDFYIGYRYGDSGKDKLDLKFVEQYTYNASVLNTVVAVKNNRTAYVKAIGAKNIDIWQSLSNDVNAFRDAPHNLPTSRDALRRKVAQYTKQGYECLISGKLKNKNSVKVKSKDQMALLDELISKHNNLDDSLVATVYNAIAEKSEWPCITATTVGNRRRKKNLISHAGRKSVKDLNNKMLMQVKRKAPSASMLYWTIDGWDVELYYQQSGGNKKGNNTTTYTNRLTVVVVLDPFNKYPVGYAIGTHETPDLIQSALKNAMNHSLELFGAYQMPFQIQTDNYAIKKLTPLYQACTTHFTPARVGNAKSKVVEPYFKYLNKTYCQIQDNWSGHNATSGSKKQPNQEFLNKIKKQFPDQSGCLAQIELMIQAERETKVNDYLEGWTKTKDEHKQTMSYTTFMLTFGSTTRHTNSLEGSGLHITIPQLGKHVYDSFEMEFREQFDADWKIYYDEENLEKVLAVSKDGKQRFELEEKYVQPMALADRTEGDADQLERIKNYNKSIESYIKEERSENAETLESFFDENPQLNDSFAKSLLTNSLGQHKNPKSQNRLQQRAKKKIIEVRAVEDKESDKNFEQKQTEYHEQKINLNDYL